MVIENSDSDFDILSKALSSDIGRRFLALHLVDPIHDRDDTPEQIEQKHKDRIDKFIAENKEELEREGLIQ